MAIRRTLLGLMAALITALAAPAFADTVSYWKPNIADPERSETFVDGTILNWDWKGGVKIVDYEKKTHAIERQNIINVVRDGSRSEALATALNKGDLMALRKLGNDAQNPLDKEEALWEAAKALVAQSARDGIVALNAFLKRFGDGNFAFIARSQLVDLLLSSRKEAEATTTLNEMTGLGNYPKAYASIKLGQMALGKGSLPDALSAFDAAAKAAAAVRAVPEQMQALAWGGEAAVKGGDKRVGEAKFKEVLAMDRTHSYDAVAIGIAYKGVADLGGKTEEAYFAYLRASYWLVGDEREADCILGALRIADALKGASETRWNNRSKALLETVQRRFPDRLKASESKAAE